MWYIEYYQVPPDTPSDAERKAMQWADEIWHDLYHHAQTHRRLRAAEGIGPAVLTNDGNWDPDQHCTSAIFGCERPVTRHTDPITHLPKKSCDKCWKFAKRHDGRWPNAKDIEKRHASEARAALEKSRGSE